MSAFEAFVTGFATDTAKNINVRKDRAEEYFESQLERARTVGTENLRNRRERLRQVTTVANNLQTQAGMPEDVLRGLINEGPETVDQAYKIYADSVANGVEVDEQFWRDIYQFSTDVKPDDQPLSEFMAQAIGLYPSNLQTTKAEGGDPFSAFVASGLGYNAMDKALTRLDTTEVAEGFTAGDLLAMDGAPESTRPLGNTGLTTNLEAIAEKERAARGTEASPTTIAATVKLFDDLVEKKRAALLRSGSDMTPEQEEEAKREAAAEMAVMVDPDILARIPEISRYMAPVEESTTSFGSGENVVPEELQTFEDDGMVFTFTGEMSGGKFVYKRDDGSYVRISPEDLGLAAPETAPTAPVEDLATDVPETTDEASSAVSQRLSTVFTAIEAGQSPVDEPALQPGENPPPTINVGTNAFNFSGVKEIQGANYAVYTDAQGQMLNVLIKE